MKPLSPSSGRPNVGKSTLFNRIVGRRLALVQDQPGVTRDRHYADAEWQGRPLALVDTGGFVPEQRPGLAAQVRAQAQLAAQQADVLLLVVDGRAGLDRRGPDPGPGAAQDRQAAPPGGEQARHRRERGDRNRRLLPARASPRSSASRPSTPAGWTRSSTRRWRGSPAAAAPPEPTRAPEDEPTRRCASPSSAGPTSGRAPCSTRCCGEERVVASPEPGTTRDPIDIDAGARGPPLRRHRHRRHPPPPGGGGGGGAAQRARRAPQPGAGRGGGPGARCHRAGGGAGRAAGRAGGRAGPGAAGAWSTSGTWCRRTAKTQRRLREDLKWTLDFAVLRAGPLRLRAQRARGGEGARRGRRAAPASSTSGFPPPR